MVRFGLVGCGSVWCGEVWFVLRRLKVKTDTRKRIDLRLSAEVYNQVLKLNSLRLAAEKVNVSVTRTISDIIEEKFRKTIG